MFVCFVCLFIQHTTQKVQNMTSEIQKTQYSKQAIPDWNDATPQTKHCMQGWPMKAQLRVQAYFQWGPENKNGCGRGERDNNMDKQRKHWTISLHTHKVS